MTTLSPVDIHQLGQPRFVARTLILLLLADEPAHGYALMDKLTAFGYDRANPGKIYRALNWLDQRGLVSPLWVTDGGNGPARRVYDVTAAGHDLLDVHASDLRQAALGPGVHPQATKFVLAKLRTRAQPVFEVEAVLRVSARSETAAAEKAERALRSMRPQGIEVVATGPAASVLEGLSA